MNDLYVDVARQLDELKPARLVIAFSGGIDSRVLLHLIARYRQHNAIPCLAVHVHHGLSDHADEWASQCQRWGAEEGIEVCVEHVTLDHDCGDSLEQMARDARYAVLAKHIDTETLMLLGQHADDQVETFLLALKRGSGPKGLSSMAACGGFAQGQLLRPLLKVTRAEIEAYAQQVQLTWVEDESNQDTRFDRNFLRHQVTPVLTQRWPSFYQAIQRSAELCATQESVLAELLQEKLQQAMHADGSLVLDALYSSSELARRQLVRLWLQHQQILMPSRKHTELILREIAFAQPDANPKLKLGKYEIRRFQQRLYCIETEKDFSSWHATLNINEPVMLPESLGCLRLIASEQGNVRLPANKAPFTISFDPSGLSACPIGRSGSRKLKKLYQEYNVPSWQRRQLPIVLCEDKVVAVVGLFISREFNGKDCELIWDKSEVFMANS